MTDDPLDDLIGSATPEKPPANDLAAHIEKRRRDKALRGKRFDNPDQIDLEELPHETEFLRPVGITFLANILKKQPYQLKKRLAKCPVIGWHEPAGRTSTPQPLYDFLTAMSYLVTPRGSIEDWFAQQNAASLPPYVNKMFWDSAHQRNRVMRSSGQLWHDEDVLIVLGRVSQTLRQEIRMWIEELPEKELLNTKQYQALGEACDRLINDIREQLVDMPKQFTTLAMSHTIREELETAGSMPESSDEE